MICAAFTAAELLEAERRRLPVPRVEPVADVAGLVDAVEPPFLRLVPSSPDFALETHAC